MPLHDWAGLDYWDGMHLGWIVETLRELRRLLPPGYTARAGSGPLVAIGPERVYPDVSVTAPTATAIRTATAGRRAPDLELTIAELTPIDSAVLVARGGRLVAAVELVSPGNKDRPGRREQYTTRYAGYLRGGVNLLLVDVHRLPTGFSFSRSIAESLAEGVSTNGTPEAVAYGVGGPAATGGRYLAVWHSPLALGAALPTMPLPLAGEDVVDIDLEATYTRAAADLELS